MQSEKTPVVFVTQELNISYAKAEAYGPVVFMTSREGRQHSKSGINAQILSEMIKAMATYRPGVDYLLPCGSPICIGLAFMVASALGKKIRMLHWQRQDESYREYTLDIDELTNLT